ncbi:bifunctional chorismate mutase/prephenate dehydrogenase [Brasilonema sp. UFV-L1]|uniref:bifunctional chorismate mutase/prephenate dehydrogenase n=1 Tax=Brasilonema sp. UFV-L1 TaxID=2234130 RepID=UPI002006E8FD|nr:bifunctional chorismate mutase/prephenate dehydrogenase [Brasilonema sp. UFV-L1]
MMFQHKLQEIDQQLIHLLGKRIEVLGELEHICLEEQFANVTLSLAQADVPESIWKNIVTGCAAAVGTGSSLPAKVEPRRVTLIGGSGLMGRFFNSRLSAAGHHVSILARSDWEQAESLLKGADLVLLCVPIESTIEVIGKIAKYLGPQTALADIASIKAPILQAMLEHHSGPVMGLHPMFGPGVQSFLSQNVVVCSGRQDEAFQWLLDLISNEGGKLIVSGAEEHDEIMVAIQAIRNFATFSLGTFLAQEELDIRRSLDFSSPVFRMEIGFISRLFAQSAPLIVDIMLATPERQQAICRLANTYNRLAQLVMQGDRDTLIHEFKTAHSCLAEQINSTLEESSHVINALSGLLAARDVEQKHSAFASPQNSTVSSTKNVSKTGMFSLS